MTINSKFTEYEFTIGNHTAQAHDYTSDLIDEAYRRKGADNPTTHLERVREADSLCEAHYASIGDFPAESVLSRLAWYIVFDEMTDSHPDKMTREEYPIMNGSQRKRREEIPSENVYFDKRDYAGFRTVHEKSDEHGTGYVKRYPIYDTLRDEKAEAQDTGIDVLALLDSAGLTERQREAIELVYFEDLTQAQACERMDVSRATLRTNLERAYAKIRRKLSE